MYDAVARAHGLVDTIYPVKVMIGNQPPPLLFSPIQLRDLALTNRVMVSPMCQYSAVNGCATDWHLMHLGHFAVSGVGMLCVEMTNVEPRGRITPYCMGLYDGANEHALKRVVEFCKRHSQTPMAIQLAHAGRKSSVTPPWEGRRVIPVAQGGWEPVAPSAIATTPDAPPPRELSVREIQDLVRKFAAAAERADRAGFDAVELHAAHGYLLHQFLSPLSNHRQDRYGGCLDHRLRFVLEVFAAMRSAWPDHKPLGVRISATDWVDGGWDLEQSVTLCRRLSELGCDWFDVSSGGLVKNQRIPTSPGYQIPFADRIKRETGVTTIAIGMITEPQQAEAILQEGQADMVALARGMLYDPRWVWHAAAVLGADVDYPNQYLRARPGVRDDVFAEREAAR